MSRSPLLERKFLSFEELGSILDELATLFRGLGTRLHRHFRDWGQHRKRALITFMLRHRNKLDLAEDQVQSLRGLRSDFERKAIRRRANIRVAEMELETLLDAEPVDLEKVKTKIAPGRPPACPNPRHQGGEKATFP